MAAPRQHSGLTRHRQHRSSWPQLPQAIPVQVKAENPFFFNQVISAFSRADSLFEPIDDFARLSLSQGNPPETQAAVVFAPAGESLLWEKLGDPLPPGPPEILSQDHPLLARVDPSLLNFEGARQLTAPKGSVVVLAHADGTPLLYTISTGEQSAVVFNFDPTRTISSSPRGFPFSSTTPPCF